MAGIIIGFVTVGIFFLLIDTPILTDLPSDHQIFFLSAERKASTCDTLTLGIHAAHFFFGLLLQIQRIKLTCLFLLITLEFGDGMVGFTSEQTSFWPGERSCFSELRTGGR